MSVPKLNAFILKKIAIILVILIFSFISVSIRGEYDLQKL